MTAEAEQRMRDEFGAAKRAWLLVVALQGLWLLAVVVSEFVTPPASPFVLLLTAAALPVALSFFRQRADGHYRVAERRRRALRLNKGLGVVPSASQRAELAAASTAKRGDEPVPLGDYYSSERDLGPDRLAHLVQEETFYTRDLALRASALALAGVVVVMGAAILTMYGALHLVASDYVQGEASGRLANACLAIVGLGVSGTLLDLRRSYAELADAASSAYEHVKVLADRGNCSLVELLPVLSSYDCALAASAPIPTIVYRINRARLDAAWRAAHLSQSGTSSPSGVLPHAD